MTEQNVCFGRIGLPSGHYVLTQIAAKLSIKGYLSPLSFTLRVPRPV